MAGILDYSRQNPWVGDSLQTLSQVLLALGTKEPALLNAIPQMLANRGQQRFENNRQTRQDERTQKLFDMQVAEQERTLNKEKAAGQAFQGLLGGVQPPNGMSQAQFGGAPTSQGILSGYSPEQASFLKSYGATDPMGAMGMVGEDLFKGPQAADAPVVKDFYEGGQVVQKQWDPATQSWQELGRGARWEPNQETTGPPEAGLQLVYGVGEDGKTYGYQLLKSGGLSPVNLPAGQTFAPNTQYLDTGTGYDPRDKRTGQTVGEIVPQNVAGAAAETEGGKAQGKAAVDLGGVENNARYIKETIKAVKEHPGRATGTGLSGKVMPQNYIPGSEAYDFGIMRKQLQGQAFLQAFESIKGGGAISEAEGAAATAAKARLDAAQSDTEFVKALDEFDREVDKLVEVARKKAGAGSMKSKYGLD